MFGGSNWDRCLVPRHLSDTWEFIVGWTGQATPYGATCGPTLAAATNNRPIIGTKVTLNSARAKGLPIGSGNVEATCKTLIGIRMKRAGSRWKEETGEHVIKLRALALSDLWDGAMAELMATQRTAVRRLVA
jgi:hypothetical protein